MFNSVYEEILKLAKDHRKFMLIGLHGVGKTEMCFQAARELGYKLLYFSASTIDPWCDIVGIPVPQTVKIDGEGKTIIKFARREDIEEAEWIMIDEANRAHPKTQNALFEMIQFKAVNGIPLKKLKLVTAAINPPDVEMNYAVTELDPAFLDRFEHYLPVKANPVVEVYTAKGIPRKIAEKSIAWWNNLGEDQKNYVTPRRLEYLMFSYIKGHSLDSCILPPRMTPNVKAIPIGTLKESLEFQGDAEEIQEVYKVYSVEWIENNGETFVRASFQPEFHYISESIKKFSIKDLNRILPMLRNCGQEFQNTILESVCEKIEKNVGKIKEKLPDLVAWVVETRKKVNDLKAASV